MKRKTSTDKRLQALRQSFDESFAASIARPPVKESFLAIRLGKRTHALPLADIGGMFARKHVTRLPTAQPALLGLAHFRGTMAPVYDLQLLLGHAPAEQPGWLVIARAAPVAFAFERFEGHLHVAREDIVTDETGTPGDEPQISIRANGKLLPVVQLRSQLCAIETMMPNL